jgi:hypothetical protein
MQNDEAKEVSVPPVDDDAAAAAAAAAAWICGSWSRRVFK